MPPRTGQKNYPRYPRLKEPFEHPSNHVRPFPGEPNFDGTRLGRPPFDLDELKPNAEGNVRPFMRVTQDTLNWLTARGGGPRSRIAALKGLLADRYAQPATRRAPLEAEEEGAEDFRPWIHGVLIEALDSERGTMTRGQAIDAIVRQAQPRLVTVGATLAVMQHRRSEGAVTDALVNYLTTEIQKRNERPVKTAKKPSPSR